MEEIGPLLAAVGVSHPIAQAVVLGFGVLSAAAAHLSANVSDKKLGKFGAIVNLIGGNYRRGRNDAGSQ